MLIIDGHSHVYPDKIAVKASQAIGSFYDIGMFAGGTVGELLECGINCEINMHVICSVATVPEQAPRINDFIAQTAALYPERFIGFATFHPDMEDIEYEVSRVIGLGLRGVKLHPDFQKFNIDDEGCGRLYKAVENRLPLLFHTGDRRNDFSSPRRILKIAERFPGLDMICAHFGGYTEWDEAERVLAGSRVWVDTSSSMSFLGKKRTLELIGRFGEDRVIFGSDYPMWNPCDEVMMIKSLGLGAELTKKIFHKNIINLLRLDIRAWGADLTDDDV